MGVGGRALLLFWAAGQPWFFASTAISLALKKSPLSVIDKGLFFG